MRDEKTKDVKIAQRAHDPLIKEYTLNYKGLHTLNYRGVHTLNYKGLHTLTKVNIP